MKKSLFMLMSTTVLFACGSSNNESQSPQQKENVLTLTEVQYNNAAIETTRIVNQAMATQIKLNGRVEVPPQNRISVSFPLGGYLKSTKLLEGMPVKKGQILAVLEDMQFIQLQEDFLTAKAQLSLTESEFKRQKELNQTKATSDKLFEQARANFQTKLVAIKSLEEKLKLIGVNPEKLNDNTISKSINVYAPISGYVSAVNVNVGKYVLPSEVMFELIDPSLIYLSLTAFEKDINALAVGQKLSAYSNTNPELKFPCTITFVKKDLQNQSSASVICSFDRFDKTLVPGLFMNAEVELTNQARNALPNDAIVRFENKQYVFVVKSKRTFEMNEVKVGTSENGYTEVVNSNNFENELFVAKGAYTLLMALKNEGEE